MRNASRLSASPSAFAVSTSTRLRVLVRIRPATSRGLYQADRTPFKLTRYTGFEGLLAELRRHVAKAREEQVDRRAQSNRDSHKQGLLPSPLRRGLLPFWQDLRTPPNAR
jgi:hypothetical protein